MVSVKLVRSQHKRPIDTGFTDSTYHTDYKACRAWLRDKKPENTLSMVVPDGVVMLDVDTEPSKSQFAQMRPSDCYQVTTNGRHWAFKITGELPASTKVLTQYGCTIDAYRVGGKNCIMIYDPKNKRHKRHWGKLLHPESLPELPEIFKPLNKNNLAQILQAIAYQLKHAYQDKLVGGDLIDMAYAGFLFEMDKDMTEEAFQVYYATIFDSAYDAKRTSLAYYRCKMKLGNGEKIQSTGTLIEAISIAGLSHILTLISLATSFLKKNAEMDGRDNVEQLAEAMRHDREHHPELNRVFTFKFFVDYLLKIKIDWNAVAIEYGLRKLSKEHYRIVFIDAVISLVDKAGLGIIFDEQEFYLYNGKYWQPINPIDWEVVLRDAIIASSAPRLLVSDQDFLKKLLEQAKKMMAGRLQKNTGEHTIINLNNTAIKISASSVDLVKHDKSHGLTYCLPYDYDQKATCPLFTEKYLDKSLPSKVYQDVLQEFMGYVFIPTYQLKLEKVLVLYGSGHNGKSVLYDIIRAMLGHENMTGCTMKDLMQEHYRAMLKNKLLNYASESPQGIDPDIFQNLVSGEPIMARQKYGRPFWLEDYAKLAFNANELPQKSSGKEAFYRRFLIIPYTVTVTKKDRDPNLANKIIKHEMSGVLNWVLEGLKRILQNKRFSYENEMTKQIEEYQNESDTVMAWLKYNHPNEIIEQNEAYKQYSQWTREMGHKSVALNKFKDRIVGAGYSCPEEKGRTFINFIQKPSRDEDIDPSWANMDDFIDVDKRLNG